MSRVVCCVAKSKSGLHVVLHASAMPIPPAVPQHVLAVAQRLTHCSFDAVGLSQFVIVLRNVTAHVSCEVLHKMDCGQHTGHDMVQIPVACCQSIIHGCQRCSLLPGTSSGRVMIAYNMAAAVKLEWCNT